MKWMSTWKMSIACGWISTWDTGTHVSSRAFVEMWDCQWGKKFIILILFHQCHEVPVTTKESNSSTWSFGLRSLKPTSRGSAWGDMKWNDISGSQADLGLTPWDIISFHISPGRTSAWLPEIYHYITFHFLYYGLGQVLERRYVRVHCTLT